MKTKLLLLSATLFLSLLSIHVYSQGVSINSDNSNPDSSAILDVKSTSLGMLFPRMTLVQRNMINQPKHSLIIYQTDDIKGYYYNKGTEIIPEWVKLVVATDSFNDNDSDPTNEYQSLGLNGQVLSLSNGGSVNLPASNVYNAGNQLNLNSGTFSVIEGHHSDLDADLLDGYHYSEIMDSVLWKDRGQFMQPKADINNNIRIAKDSNYMYGFYSNITADTSSAYGAYLKSNSTNNDSYGLYAESNYSGINNTNTSYGAKVVSNSTARDNTAICAEATVSTSTTFAKLKGVSVLTNHAGLGNSYGLSSDVYSTHQTNASNIYGIYTNVRRWRTNQNGSVYGTYSKADEGEYAYGVYAQATDADTNYGIYSTAYGGQANYAAYFEGDVEVTENLNVDGYITAGNATATTITRYASQEFTYDSPYSFDDNGYRYIPINSIDFPSGVSDINIKSIRWECDALHQDGNEIHGIWVGIGSSSASASYYGFLGSTTNGQKYIDWHYIEDDLNLNRLITENIIIIRLRDEDGVLKGDDNLSLYNMHIVITYSYSIALRDGDIAASGRVYANNNTAIGDLAEHFEYKGDVVAGYIISYQAESDNNYIKCKEAYSNHITGVISENPSIVLNSSNTGPAVALAGRVKVKLIDSKNLVKGGDFITSSSQAGLGQIAYQAGPVIGYAVKDQKEGEDFVEVLLQLGKFYIPENITYLLKKEENIIEKQVNNGDE